MTDANSNEVGTSVVPVLRYRNLPAAIDWLCAALGFARHRVVAGKDGAIMFAQLTLGNAMVMVGPVRQSAFDKLLKQPDEIGGAETQVCYFFVADAHAHCAKAKAAGAQIIFSVEDKLNGGRSYSCRDPEGHVWNFGTYDPWRQRPIVETSSRRRSGWRAALRAAIIVIGPSVVMVAAVIALGWVPSTVQQVLRRHPTAELTTDGSEGDPTGVLRRLARERTAREAAARAAREALARLAEARSGKEAAEEAAKHAWQQLAEAREALQATERTAEGVRGRLAEAENARAAAEQAAKEAGERLARAWSGKGAAERAAREARRQLSLERNARRAAELLPPSNQSPSQATTTPWR